MSLRLDLSASSAKVDRAFEHLEVLEREIPVSVMQNGPYAIRFSEVDQQTGWCDMVLVPNQARKPRLGVVFGDVVHNLRCALDYIITAIADASNVQLTTKHQFPIFVSAPTYRAVVGTVRSAHPAGPLGGITHGLVLVEQLQPYHRKPEPRTDPLWHVHRFSNADKHREVAGFLALPGGSIQITYNGTVVEKEEVSQIPDWSPDKEYVICRLRFYPPIAYNLRAQGPLRIGTGFRTRAFGGEPEHAVHIEVLRETCDYVRVIVDLFKQV